MEERDPTKNEQIIQELRAEVETLKAEKEEIKEKMKLDRQLQTLFPKHDKLVLSTLNFVHMVEKNKALKHLYKKMMDKILIFSGKIFKKVSPYFESNIFNLLS